MMSEQISIEGNQKTKTTLTTEIFSDLQESSESFPSQSLHVKIPRLYLLRGECFVPTRGSVQLGDSSRNRKIRGSHLVCHKPFRQFHKPGIEFS